MDDEFKKEKDKFDLVKLEHTAKIRGVKIIDYAKFNHHIEISILGNLLMFIFLVALVFMTWMLIQEYGKLMETVTGICLEQNSTLLECVRFITG